MFGQKVRAAYWEIRILRIPAKRQRIDRKTSYRWMYCEIIDMMKGQLAERYSEILKLKFVSLLGSRNFEHYSES
jgi:hypothetical protein